MNSADDNYYPILKEIVVKNRTYRRFYQEHLISEEEIKSMIELARLSGFGGNRQSFKFFAVLNENKKEEIFKTLVWANYYKDWKDPEEGEKPSAYIVIFHDKDISNTYFWEHGIAAQSILLGAVSMGFGGCMFGSFGRQEVKDSLGAPDNLMPLMVIALGKPKEEVIIEGMEPEGSVEYWRDEENRHHVPKRALKDILKVF